MRTRTLVSAGGVVLDGEGRIAITSRRSFKGDLQWVLPKGLVEPGEGLAQAAAREAREETGLEVEVVSPIRTIDYWYVEPARGGDGPTRVHKRVHFFLMHATGGATSNHDAETEEVALLQPAEAAVRASFDSEREVISEAASLQGS